MGKAFLVCGSRGMAGAAILAAGGCLRGGVGYALMAVPASIAAELAISRPEAVLHLQGQAQRQRIEKKDVAELLQVASQADAVAIGPGIGVGAPGAEIPTWVDEYLRLQALSNPAQPLLLDADALNQVALASVDLKALQLPNLVLTPHPGEAARLLSAARALNKPTQIAPAPGAALSAAEIQKNRNTSLNELVDATQATVLLKGAQTLVGSPNRDPWQNPSGNAGMATAGSGDVLTGLICCLLARGMPTFEATCLGAYLHGLAGDLAAAKLGLESLVASDLVDFLPTAIQLHQQAR
jgi:hydroxyethylthiazole kinase-like uncharacterized protein yjeF